MPVIGFSTILFGTALIITLLVTPGIRLLARRVGALDHPDGRRKLHAFPVPKLGGIAVFAGAALTVAFVLPLWDSAAAASAMSLATRCVFPATLILLLGIADDLWGVPPWGKLAVQVIAALLICAHPDLLIAKMTNPFNMTIGGIGILSIPLTLAWIVLITNAFNIVDGVDGLASGVAFVATACLFLAAIQRPDDYTVLLVAPLAGALIGFLRYNFAPASIFLGDSGSLLVGFLIAVLALAGENKSSTAIAVATPLLSLALPLAETAVSIVRRFLRGQPFWLADNGHFHHRLLRRGFSTRRAALLLYAGSGLFGAASLLLDSSRVVGGLATIILVVVAWIGIRQLEYSEFSEVQRALKRGFLYQRRIIQNSILVRTLGEELRQMNRMDAAWPRLIDVLTRLGFERATLVANTATWWAPPALAPDVFPDWQARNSSWSVEEWLCISIRVDTPDSEARIEVWRSRHEEPLHSELAILLDVVSRELPRILASERQAPVRHAVLQEVRFAGGLPTDEQLSPTITP